MTLFLLQVLSNCTHKLQLPSSGLALLASLLCSIYFAYPSAEGPMGLVMQKSDPSEIVSHTGN